MQDTHSELLRQRTTFKPLRALAGLLLVPAIVLGGLWVFGHPGLRITYTWDGNAAYYSCEYITALGWKSRRANCPLFTRFQITKENQ